MSSEKIDYSPKTMEGFIKNGLHVLEKGEKIPKILFKACKGIILISCHEDGFLITKSSGAGVAMMHKDGKWSNPIAVSLDTLGWGAGIGFADKQILILLNHFAMNRLMEGKFQAKLGVDFGFVAGSIGGAISADMALSLDKGGFGTSIGYTWSQGVMLNVEVQTGFIFPDANANKFFYKTSDNKVILEGTETVHVDNTEPIDVLHAKLDEVLNKKEEAEEETQEEVADKMEETEETHE